MARTSKHWVVCLRNEGYEVSLEKRKLSIALPGDPAERHGRVAAPESGASSRKAMVAVVLLALSSKL